MRTLKSALLASTLVSASALSAQAEINVVTSIKPVHSLVSAVMEGVGSPYLILESGQSPHTYSLKPSQAKELENADVVFWIGQEIESFLEKPLESIAANAKAVELIDTHDLVKLKLREGGAFDSHDHDHGEHDDHADHNDHDHSKEAKKDHDHDHGEHDDHASHDDHDHDKEAKAEKDHDHDHEEKAEKDHDHDHDHSEKAEAHDDHDDHAHGDEHAHGEFDAHVWLDPVNAKALVHEIEEVLAEADPANAAKYEANAEALEKKLDSLTAELTAELEPVKGKGFIVFHDAYQSFENRFGLEAVGSVTVSPEVMPGAERISELREKVKNLSATCVFSEPQFEPKLVTTVTEGTNARTGVLDPLGTRIENGPELYFTLLRNMSVSFKTCLSESS